MNTIKDITNFIFLGKDIEENIQFQNWRKTCKEVAKKLTNE